MSKHSRLLSTSRRALTWRASFNRLRASAMAMAGLSGLVTGLTVAPRAQAGNDAWDTNPTTGNFTGTNWTTNSTTPGAGTGTIASGDSLYFGASSITTLNDDEANGFSLAGFTFNAGASAFTIGGNAFALTGAITNNSSVLQTINDAFTMTNASGFFTTSGNLTLGGNITETSTGGAVFTIAGAAGGAVTGGGTVTLGGTDSFTASNNIMQVIGGSTLAITGTTSLALNGNYFAVGQGAAGAGTVTVASGGTLNVTGNSRFIVGTFGGGTFNVNGTANFTGAALRLGYSGQSTVNLNSGGVISTDSNIVIDNVSTGSTAVFNFNGGTLRANANNLTLLGASNLGITTVTTSSSASAIDANSYTTTIAAPVVNGSTVGGLTITDSSTAKGGVVTLSGASTYTGATTVNAGTLQAGVASVANVSGAFGNNSAVTLANVAGATLALNNFNTQIGSLTGGGTTGGNVTLGTATLTVGGDNTSPAAYAGVISGGTGGGLTKIGSGTQILGGANTYTGATSVTAGTLSLSGSLGSTAITTSGAGVFSESSTGVIGGTASFNQASTGTSVLGGANTYTGGTSVNAGTLSLTGSLNASSALVLGGGTFAYAAPSGTGTQTVAGVTLATGTYSGLGTTVAGDTLALGGITRQAGSGVNFTLTGTVTTTTGNTTSGILGGYATVGGTSWAVAGTAGTATAITALTNYTATSTAGTTATNYAGGNIDVNSSVAPTAAITPNTLRFNTAATAETLTLTGTNSVASGGILMTPNAGVSANVITGGTLTSGAGELFLNNYDTTSGGSLTLGSAIANNGSTALAVTVGGGGTTTLSGALSYTGATTVASGTLAINSAASTLPGTITVGAGAGGASTLNLAPTGTLTLSTGSTVETFAVGAGSNTGAAVGVVNQTSGTVTSGSMSNLYLAQNTPNDYGAYNMSGGSLTIGTLRTGGFGSTVGGSSYFLQTGGTVGVLGNAFVNRTSNGTNIYYINGGALNVTTNLQLDDSGTGTGVLTLASTANGSAAVKVGGIFYIGGGGGTSILNLNGGLLNASGFTVSTTNGSTNVINFNGGTLQASASPTTLFTAPLTNATIYAGGGTIDTNGQNITFNQVLQGAGGKTGVSSVPLASGGSGYIGAPVVSITGGGGTGASAIATLNGSGQVSGITITSPGTGYTSAPTISLIGGGGTGASLGSITTGTNAADGGLTKIGTGTLTLNAANTYTGATTVGAGTLDLANALALQNSTLTTSSSGGATTFDSAVTGNAFTIGGLAGSGNLALTNNATTPAGIALTAGGNNTSTAYSGVLSGSGSLTKTGTGTLTLSGFNTYTGGTIVSGIGSTLALNAGGTGSGTVQGAVTVGPGATLSLTTVDALGYTQNQTTTALNVNGGTVNNATGGNEGFLTSFNLTGGTMTSTGGGSFNINAADASAPGITSNASPTLSTISGGLDIRAGNLNVAVATGSTASGVDLRISGVISDQGGLNKTGSGYLDLTGQNTFGGNVSVTGGTLNVGAGGDNGGAFSALGVANTGKTITVTGATLSGTVNNWFGNGKATNLPAITVNTAGTLSTTRYTALGTLNLNGATVTAASTDTGNFQAFAFTGNVAVGGTSPSTITSTNVTTTTGGYHLGNTTSNTPASTLFTVASTGTAGTPDLTVSAPLLNSSGDFGNKAGGLTKAGAGVMALTATNTYTGPTAVTAGTLLVNGSTAAGSVVTVNNSGSVLGGVGTVSGVTTINTGSSITGATIGTVGALTLQSNLAITGGTYAVDISGTTSDKLTISGALTLSGANITFTGTPTPGTTYVLATDASETGAFAGTAPSGFAFQFNSGGTELDLVPVPEPATWLAGFLLLGTLGMTQRRRLAGWLGHSPA